MRLKLILLLSVVLIAGAVLALPELSAYGAHKALTPEYRDRPWAEGCVYWAARINMRMLRYEAAGELLEEGMQVYPEAFWRRQGVFYVGLCHERLGNSDKAVRWYRMFVNRYPDDPWKVQAQHRISNLEANS